MKRDKKFKKMKRMMTKRIQRLNKQLRNDVFKDRFEVRAFRFDVHAYFDGSYNLSYGVECIDHKTGQVDRIYWVNDFEFIHGTWRMFSLVNDTIVNSDFWDDYRLTHPRNVKQFSEMRKNYGY